MIDCTFKRWQKQAKKILLLGFLFGFLSFQLDAQSIIYVKASANGTNSGASWANAYTSLQSAVESAVSGDQIWVAAGTYKPTKDINGDAAPVDARTKTFLLKNGVKIYGGFSGSETVFYHPQR
jgi:hypothetical protein